MKSLIIVESPTKTKTISKFLGKDYIVDSCKGHIRDLPKNEMGIKITDNEFTPKYVTVSRSWPIIKRLKQEASVSDKILLAPDPDREGEAIAWHLYNILSKSNKNIKRITFNEITKSAVLEALDDPDEIDINKVNAQQARRILDRIVGYKLSPILWKVVSKGLSAGRVQSVALRFICEREKSIKNFVPEEYWHIFADLKNSQEQRLKPQLFKKDNEKIEIKNKKQAETIETELKNSIFTVSSVKKKKRQQSPYPPLITSRLQQLASAIHYFSTTKTMRVAQQLYEGISISDDETVGLITYMRTDSTRVSNLAKEQAAKFIEQNFGKRYLSNKKVKTNSKKSKRIQDAHEAIRPTNVFVTPASIKNRLTTDQHKMYSLIWNTFVASQMANSIYDTTTIEVLAGNYLLRLNGSIEKFDGFKKAYPYTKSTEVEVPDVKEGENLTLIEIEKSQHFTQPPPRYTEASLVKELEEKGIGRPSTYASIVSTIQKRNYVCKVKQSLTPTDLGMLVNKFLVHKFNSIVEAEFTANLEEKLDKVETGELEWQDLLKNFYSGFNDNINLVYDNISEMKKITQQDTDIKCEKCGTPMVIKHTLKGKFITCPAYPKCKNIKRIKIIDDKIEIIHDKKLDEKCPQCGAQLIEKHGRFGKFIACSNYPKCKFTRSPQLDINCPKKNCSGKVELKFSRKGKFRRKFYGCSNYPNCDFVSWKEPVNESCPLCGSNYLIIKSNTKKIKTLSCPNKECDFTKTSGNK